MAINTITIGGNIGHAPEKKMTASGTTTLKFSVCVNDRKKNDRGEWEDVPNWVDVIVFGNYAEFLSRHLDRGSKVVVSGRIHENKWKTKEGANRSKLEIIADNVEHLGGYVPEPQPEQETEDTEDVYTEDIPF